VIKIRDTFKSYKEYMDFYKNSKGYDLGIDKITDNDRRGIPEYERWQFGLEFVQGDILDIGSWTGRWPVVLKANGFNVDCVEANKAAYEYLKKHTDLKCSNTMIEEFKTDKKYDTITCFEVIEHAYNMRKFIDKIVSLLKPHGLLILSTPSKDGCYKDEDNKIHLWTADIYSLAETLRDFQIEEMDIGDLILIKARLL